jgi:general secretion pathway protein L
MKLLSRVAEPFGHWIDAVAANAATVLERLASPHVVALVEDETDEFLLRANDGAPGSPPDVERVRFADGQIVGATPSDIATLFSGRRIDLILRPERFLIQPLELPRRATEFLDGIVRSQIDQLTPWSASDVAFGWSKPTESGADRIVVTVAATALALVTPYVESIATFEPRSIAVFTSLGGTILPIKVLERTPAAARQIDRIRRHLRVAIVGAGLAAVATVGAALAIDGGLDAQEADLARRIAEARIAAGAERTAAASSSATTLYALGQRKHEVAPAVITLDTLSQILPDHTYVTELRIEDDKLQVTGVTRDAPSLIGLLEQSGRFTRATFFAPTTRVASEPGERFHIEAHIQALASAR